MLTHCEQSPAESSERARADSGIFPSTIKRNYAKHIAVTMLLAFLPFLTLEAISRLIVSFAPPIRYGSRELDRKVELALHPPLNPSHKRILIVGDSAASNGIYSELLTALLQHDGCTADVLNLATCGATAKDELFLLQLALRSGFKPTLVICDVSPFMCLSALTHWFDSYSDHFATSAEGRLIACPAQNLGQTLSYKLSSYSYLWKYRGFIKACLLSLPKRIWSPYSQIADQQFDVAAISPLGWNPIYFVPAGEPRVFLGPEKLAGLKPELSGAAVKSVLRPLQQLCQSNRLSLLFVYLPRYSKLNAYYQSRYKNQSNPSLSTLSTALTSQGHTCTGFVDLQLDDKREHFADVLHPSAAGAVEVTYRLAEALRSPDIAPLLQPPN